MQDNKNGKPTAAILTPLKVSVRPIREACAQKKSLIKDFNKVDTESKEGPPL